jgi:hypothetical protein
VAYKDPERRRAAAKAWRARNRGKVNAYQRAYRVRNGDRIRELERASRKPGRNREYYARNREADLARSQKWRHDLTPYEWAAILRSQDGQCYLCGRDLTSLKPVMDHDHRCCEGNRSCRVCRRGIACDDCNRAIGFAGDDPDRLRRMANALEAAQREVKEQKALMSAQLSFGEEIA